MAVERLQKIIARAGVTSRRKAEKLIEAGRVAVNERVVRELGATADIRIDTISLDGRPLLAETRRYLALHKPRGALCAVSDRTRRPLVVDLLGEEITERVYPAGRLDLDSEGLVLLTNDGELMEAITRPGSGVAKVYEVSVCGWPREEDLQKLAAGVELGGQRTLPCAISSLSSGCTARFRMVLHEGKKNQIRRMFKEIGNPVKRLIRVAIGPLLLGSLPSGSYRDLTGDEVDYLRDAARRRRQRPAQEPAAGGQDRGASS